MSELLTWRIQKALSSCFSAHSLAGGRIYDMTPPAPVFPYVVLGEDQMKVWDSRTTQGYEIKLMIHVFSKCEGRSEVKEIAENIRSLLTIGRLKIENFSVLQLSVESIQTSRDIRTKTCQALLKVVILGTEEGKIT